MEDRVLIGLAVLFSISAAASVIIYCLVICRRLYRDGAKFPTGFIPWRFFDVLRRYKDLCRSTSDSLSPYYIYVVLFLFAAVLGLVVLIGYLWQQSTVGT